MSIAATTTILSLYLEEKLKERGLSFTVSTAKGPITQLTSAISSMGIPAIDKEQEKET